VENAVRINAHVSKADLIIDAVREKLEKMGLLQTEASRTGTVQKPQAPSLQDPHQRMQRAIENVKRAAENSPFRGE
jgi:hypothetical protein